MRSWEVMLVALLGLMMVVSVAVARDRASGIEAGIARTAEQRREARCQETRERSRLAEEILAGPAAPELHARQGAQVQKYDAALNVDQYCR